MHHISMVQVDSTRFWRGGEAVVMDVVIRQCGGEERLALIIVRAYVSLSS